MTPNLDARPVDPRDARWEAWNPGYRVYFWRREGDSYTSREFGIATAEVDEVLAWIDDNRLDGETFRFCASRKKVRPGEFPDKEGVDEYIYLVFKRVK